MAKQTTGAVQTHELLLLLLLLHVVFTANSDFSEHYYGGFSELIETATTNLHR